VSFFNRRNIRNKKHRERETERIMGRDREREETKENDGILVTYAHKIEL
jgi:hypothetical protein